MEIDEWLICEMCDNVSETYSSMQYSRWRLCCKECYEWDTVNRNKYYDNYISNRDFEWN